MQTSHLKSSVSEGYNALFIAFKISAKLSYRADTDTRKLSIYRPIPIWWLIYRASLYET